MRDGFIRVAAATPKVRVADTVFNGEQVVRLMEEGYEKGAKLMVFPELCLTAYTCGDLFLSLIHIYRMTPTAKPQMLKMAVRIRIRIRMNFMA